MALIGKIRNNMWLVFVAIALATLSFILMDSQGPGGGAVNDTTLGVINGTKIDYRDFDRMERVLFTNSAQDPLMRRAGLWDYFVNKTIVENESEKLGLGVGKSELIELQFGQNLSPIIFQNYRNPQTGQVDIAQLQQIKNAIESDQEMNPGFRQYWAEQEKQVVSTQLQTKLNSLVQKGIYTPTWMAEEVFKIENTNVDLEVIKIPFDDIPADNISLTDADFRNYINDHIQEFERDKEARVLEYVSMDVVANNRDSSVWREEINSLISEFRDTEADSLFAFTNNGSYQNYYAKSEEIAETIRDVVPTMQVGEVYGPYVSLRNYQAVKLIDRKVVPDSVEASHILVRAEAGNVTLLNRANELIDSLEQVINTGGDFADLAEQFSDDPGTKSQGGDLGTFAQGFMVPAFNDVCFLSGREGGLYKVQTQFGVHLIKIKDQIYNNRSPKHKLAFISVPIIPTKESQDELYEMMVDLVGSYSYLDDLKSKVDEIANLEMVSSNDLKENDYSIDLLGPGNTSRDMVKFAFNENTEIGDLSPEVYTYTDPQLYYNRKYVIAGLSKIKEPGVPSVEEVRDNVEVTVMNQKKANAFLSQLKGKSFEQIASDRGIEIDTVLNASLNSVFVPGLGNEPKVMGTAYNVDQGQTSQPIVGNSGVFVVRKISATSPGESSGLVSIRNRLSNQSKGAKSFKVVEAIRDKSVIKDLRSTFY